MTQEAIILLDEPRPNPVQVGSGTASVILGGVAGGGAAPVIDNFDPPVGTPLARSDSVSFDVTDDTGLLRGEVFVTLGGDTFVVHDGDNFRGQFANLSSRSPIVAGLSSGFRYTVRRNGGWIESPTFEVHATDTSGQEAT